MTTAKKVTLDEAYQAQKRIANDILRTPLVKLKGDYGDKEIYLKLENLQAIGAFKLRGAGNAMKSTEPQLLKNGVWTASAGNMAQGVAWYARKLNLKCTIIVPDTAPQTKLDAINTLGAKYIKVPFDEWITIMKTHQSDRIEGYFIHPFNDPKVMAGNGTIAIEILEDLKETDAIIVPYGGGGLSCGIASVAHQINPDIDVFACEPETAAALHVSFEEGKASTFPYQVSFVDGMGSPLIFPEMWELAKNELKGSLVVSLQEIANAIKLLVENNKVVAEGAGAASVAAAIKYVIKAKKIVCIISGGNIDTSKLVRILENQIP